MKTEYNRYERIAGIFVLIALIGVGATTVGVAIKKGWFASKQTHHTFLKTANGIHSGTDVQMSGIKVGWVDYVELIKAGEVKITFYIFERYAQNVRKDSRIQVVRPYLIGEKVLEVSVGEDTLPIVPDGDFIPGASGIDMVDLLSGRLLGPLMSNLENLVADVQSIVTTIDDADVNQTLRNTLDYIEPLVKNMNDMSREVAKTAAVANRNKRFETMLEGMDKTTKAMNELLPVMAKATPEMAQSMKGMPELTRNMLQLTEDLKQLMPMIHNMSDGAPEATEKAIQVMDESILTMKALQKTFLLKGKVKEVIEEEQ
jgi:phospholipid/cholesterol/gamma-HCH transport system substrate-binding protein